MQKRHWVIILIAGAAILAASAFLSSRTIKSGEYAPDFTLTSAVGDEVSLSDLRGKIVVIQFFASWCGQCMAELPEYNAFAGETDKETVAFVAISEDDPSDVEFVRMMAEQRLSNLTVLLDTDSKVADLFGSYSLPDTYIIDREGRLVRQYEGTADLNWRAGSIRDLIMKSINSGE